MSTKSEYSKEFKEKAIRLVLVHGKPASAAARELGIPDWKVRDWVRAAKRKESQGMDASSQSQAEENAKLKKRLKELEMENEILKKATAYFAKALP
jgi:transposase